MANVEVIDAKPALLKVVGVADGARVVIVTVAQHNHGLEDGDVVVLDDMFVGQTAAKVDTRGVAFKTALALPTAAVVANFERQYDFYNTAFEQEAAAESKKKLPVRTITIFNRLALVFDDDAGKELLAQEENSDLAAIFGAYQSGGLLN